MTEEIQKYNKSNPFLAAVKERKSLCTPGSQKSTYHIVLDLKGSDITYQVGDSVAIFPHNDPDVVKKTLEALHATGAEIITEKHSGKESSLWNFLKHKANLAEVSRKLIQEICQRQTNPQKKEHFEVLLSEGQKEALKEYQLKHEVWDALAENAEAVFTPQEICHLLMPLLPRFYSIASSMAAVGNEVHLTVAELVYETNGYVRRGICTHYLCRLAPMNEHVMPIYIQPSNGFTLPEDKSAPVIMIGPGTGVAPFRAFMQERQMQKASGVNWLFFGEWHQNSEFFYEDYWLELVRQGKMRLSTAFSRDQEHKIYVQHRLLEHGKEVFELLEQGAYLYVCGDARRMAKDVDLALHQLIQKHCPCDEQGAKDYLKKLRASKRYLRDVY
jgi:sulfite reductase (NADPH) flavoprotein alpha-component